MQGSRRQVMFSALGAAVAATLPALAQGADTVTIGWTGPLTGGAALYGKNTLTGLEMAAKEINDAGGVAVGGNKVKLSVTSFDDKYSPSEAAVNAKRLRAQYKAPVVFCPHSGGIYAMQAFNEADGFLIGAYTSTPQTTERGNKLTLRIPPSFAGYADPFTRVEMAKFGKKLGMAGGDHDYAKSWSALIDPAWKAAGGTVVADNPMSYNKDTDFYSGVSRVVAGSPDVLFIGGASEPTALVARQARELGFKGGFMVMDQAKLDEMAAVLGGYDMLEGAVGVLPTVFDTRPGPASFVARFKKAYGRDPGSESTLNYSGLHAVAAAMRLSGSATDATAIRGKLDEAFKTLPQDNNPAVILGVTPAGASDAALLVGVVQNGKVIGVSAATAGKS